MSPSIKIYFSNEYASNQGRVTGSPDRPVFLSAEGIEGYIVLAECSSYVFDSVKIVLEGVCPISYPNVQC